MFRILVVTILLLTSCSPKIDYFGIGNQHPCLKDYLENVRDTRLCYQDSTETLAEIRRIMSQVNDTALLRIHNHYIYKTYYYEQRKVYKSVSEGH